MSFAKDMDFNGNDNEIIKAHQDLIASKTVKSTMSALDPNCKYEAKDLLFMINKNEKSHQFFGGYIIMRESVLAQFYCALLVLLLFLERFCFMVVIYKTKCTNYILLFFVTVINSLILYIQKCLNQRKVSEKMHEMFDLAVVH